MMGLKNTSGQKPPSRVLPPAQLQDPLITSCLQFRRRLVLTFVAVNLLLLGLIGYYIHHEHRISRDTARKQTQTFVLAMDAHVRHVVRSIDLSLNAFGNALRLLPREQAASFEAVQDLIAPATSLLDEDFFLIFVDAKGKGMASSNRLPVRGVSYADRHYFTSHAANPNLGMLISPPAMGKVSKKRSFFISRRVVSADGEFLGVITAVIDASSLASVFKHARSVDDVSVTLAHQNGDIIARYPLFQESFGKNLTNAELFRQYGSKPEGSYETVGVIDNQSRFYSYRPVTGLPLVINVSVATALWEQTLATNLLLGGGVYLLFFLILGASTLLAVRSFQSAQLQQTRHRALYQEAQQTREQLAASE